jgi:CDP-glucose 4,6-dehydratase
MLFKTKSKTPSMKSPIPESDLSKHYKGKKVFVTGHTGFKGSWLMACLHSFGAKFKGYALAPEYENGLYELLHPSLGGESVIADVRNKERLEEEIISFKPDIIFHLAAQPLVRKSYENPTETFETNVIGTANLLNAVAKLEYKCTVVVITSDKVYENKENGVLYKEEDILGGYDPYSASKACMELVVSSFHNSFFNVSKYATHQKALASARAGNVIGGGDWSRDRIIPDVVRSLAVQEEIKVRNPKAIRPWQHVLEPLSGYLMLGASLHKNPLSFSKAYNFGPHPKDHLTVEQIVKKAIEVWGKGTWKDTSDPTQPHEAVTLRLDINRAQKELKWKPNLNAASAIEWTIEWYKQSAASRVSCTFQQIKNYFNSKICKLFCSFQIFEELEFTLLMGAVNTA